MSLTYLRNFPVFMETKCLLSCAQECAQYHREFNVHGFLHRNNILILSNKMQHYTVYFIWRLLYMFQVVPSPIIRSANNCIYSIWYLSHHYCYLPLLWKSWNWFEFAVGGVRHPQYTQTSSTSSIIATDNNNSVRDTRFCRYSCLRS
jgi:hypothetical protein